VRRNMRANTTKYRREFCRLSGCATPHSQGHSERPIVVPVVRLVRGPRASWLPGGTEMQKTGSGRTSRRPSLADTVDEVATWVDLPPVAFRASRRAALKGEPWFWL